MRWSPGHPKRPRVIDAKGSVVVEQRDARPYQGNRVAVIAHYSTCAKASKSLNALARGLLEADYRVVVSSGAPVPEPLSFEDGVQGRLTVLRKPNIGYDFGSWAMAQAWDPSIQRAKHVILTNDSLVGPFAPLREMLGRFEASKADVYGMTSTTQFGPHLQSYFLGFNDAVLSEPALSRFWRSIRHERDKEVVIHRNEIGLGQLLRRKGFSQDAAFPYWRVVDKGLNPTILGWQRLLEIGFPFVKRQILRTPEVAPNADQVPNVVRRLYGAEVREWL